MQSEKITNKYKKYALAVILLAVILPLIFWAALKDPSQFKVKADEYSVLPANVDYIQVKTDGITLKNNNELEISFKNKGNDINYLENCALYSIDEENKFTPVLGDEITDALNQTYKINNSISFKVISDSIALYDGSGNKITVDDGISFSVDQSESSAFAPSVTVKFNAAASFEGFGLTHTLHIKITDGTSLTTLIYFITLEPSSQIPLVSKSIRVPLSLCGGADNSDFSNPLNKVTKLPVAGTDSVRIYAANLSDYPLEFMRLAPESAVVTGESVSARYFTDADGNGYYSVTAEKNGTATVSFKLFYKEFTLTPSVSDIEQSIVIPLKFTVADKYFLGEINVTSKKSIIRISDIEGIDTIQNNNYFLQSVISQNDAVKVEFKDNKITVTTEENTKTSLKFVFRLIEEQGQELTVKTTLNASIEVTNWFSELSPTMTILVIAGIVAAAIILTLVTVWIFFKIMKKRKKAKSEDNSDEYISKLNSLITQAKNQQQLAEQSYSNLMKAKTTTRDADVYTVTGQPAESGGTMTLPPIEEFSIAKIPPNPEDIFIPLSDDFLIERIYSEKYEPKGMSRRGFYKNRELIFKELEREKTRIRYGVISGLTIEEACKTEKERSIEQKEFGVEPKTEEMFITKPMENELNKMLGFDYTVVLEDNSAIPDIDKDSAYDGLESNEGESLTFEEESLLKAVFKYNKINKEAKDNKQRFDNASTAHQNLNTELEQWKKACKELDNEIAELDLRQTALDERIAAARGKDKEKAQKDLLEVESVRKAKTLKRSLLQKQIREQEHIIKTISDVVEKLKATDAGYGVMLETQKVEVDRLKIAATESRKRLNLDKEKIRQNKLNGILEPAIELVAKTDREIYNIKRSVEKLEQKKSNLSRQHQALSGQLAVNTDSTAISELNREIADKDSKINKWKEEIAQLNKKEAECIEKLKEQLKKIDEFIEAEEMELDVVIEIEDKILNRLAYESLRDSLAVEKRDADIYYASLKKTYDELSSGLESELAFNTVEVADGIRNLENDIGAVRSEVEYIKGTLSTTPTEERARLSVMLMELTAKQEQLVFQLEEMRTAGIKSNLEHKYRLEEDLKSTEEALLKAQKNCEELDERLKALTSLSEHKPLKPGIGLVARSRNQSDNNLSEADIRWWGEDDFDSEQQDTLEPMQNRPTPEEIAQRAEMEARRERLRREAMEDAILAQSLAGEEAQRVREEALLEQKIARRKREIAYYRRKLKVVESSKRALLLEEKFYNIYLSLDDDEKQNAELIELIDRNMKEAAQFAKDIKQNFLRTKARSSLTVNEANARKKKQSEKSPVKKSTQGKTAAQGKTQKKTQGAPNKKNPDRSKNR